MTSTARGHVRPMDCASMVVAAAHGPPPPEGHELQQCNDYEISQARKISTARSPS
jgi:hypothetical protein